MNGNFNHINLLKEKLTDDQFRFLGEYVENRIGIMMPLKKKSMLEGRLRKRLKALRIKDFTEYIKFVFNDEEIENEEIVHMIDVVTTNKTDFFREPDHFDFLTNEALAELGYGKGAEKRKNLKVWSAGCSTGEEPYTLAMVLEEFSTVNPGFELEFNILATDISVQVLEYARRGIYSADTLKTVPENHIKKYFMKSKDPDNAIVKMVPEIRAKIKFQRINFMDEDFCIKKPADIVFFRNVQIYFSRETRIDILNRILDNLRPGGLIFIGHSESLEQMNLPLEKEKPTVYRKTTD